MQHTLDDGTLLYQETADSSGFVVRELIETKNKNMRYQVGRFAFRPMRIPMYAKGANPPLITHHTEGDDVRVFHLTGHGSTLAKAMMQAERNNKTVNANRQQASRMINDLVGI